MSAMALLPHEQLSGSPVRSPVERSCWGQPRIRTDWEETHRNGELLEGIEGFLHGFQLFSLVFQLFFNGFHLEMASFSGGLCRGRPVVRPRDLARGSMGCGGDHG